MVKLRRTTVPISLYLFLLLVLVSAHKAEAKAHQPGQNQVWKQQIESLEQDWRTALMTSNLSMMDRLMSEDYVGISMTGEISTKTMQLDRLRTSKLTLSKLDLTDVKVKLLGRVAIVTSLADVVGTVDGRPIAGRFRYTRVYQRTGSGGWKTTNFEATRLSGRHDHKRAPDGESWDNHSASAAKSQMMEP